MTDENIKGIPEEETAELNGEEILQEDVQEEETVTEEVQKEISEEIESDEKEETSADEPMENEEAEETEVSEESETSEETEVSEFEETEKMIDEENLCICRGEKEKSEDSDYCSDCEEKMLTRKIPFTAWISGLAAIVFSVFALALVFILTAPSLQVAKGDSHARNNRWYKAYTEYSNVPSVIDELTTILGGESLFVQTGSGFAVRKFDALAHYTSPLEAFYYEGTNVEHLEGSSNPTMKKYYEIYNEYMSSYDIIIEMLETTFGETEPAIEEMHAAVEELRGTEGVSDIWIDYYHYTFAYNYGEPNETILGYLKDVEESTKKSDLDYTWLYCTELADMFYKTGDTDSSVKYLDKLIKNDKTNFSAYELKMRITLKNATLEDAKNLLDEYSENNEGTDTAYVLEIMYYRSAKEYDKALELCNEALEEYASSPELSRQLALIYLLKGDYDNAFENVLTAFNNAAYIANYYGDNSSLTDQLYYTLYLCAYLESENGSMTSESVAEIPNIMAELEEFATESESVSSIINGTKTIEQVLTEGEFDLV